ncbi:MAG: polysaccharide deacetylase family protein [Bacillaceae bacterium]
MKKKIAILFLVAVVLISIQYKGMAKGKKEDALYRKIEEQNKEMRQPAQNAVVDPEWKAIPGINGIEIDVEETYEKVRKKKTFVKEDVVLKETKPTIHLRDLPPTPMYRGNSQKKMVAIIMNVAKGWKDNSVEQIVETLKKHKVQLTFFVEGQWAADNAALMKKMIKEGHEFGNHSYRHPDMSNVGIDRIRKELIDTNAVIEQNTNRKVTWFAPPSGSYNDTVVKEAFNQGMWTVMWSVDTIDWRRPPVHVIVERVRAKVHPGAIILMHPTKPSSEALEQIILLIKEKGLEVGTVSQLTNEKR